MNRIDLDMELQDDRWARLHELLKGMDVPPDRYSDVHWLSRNLGIRNRTNGGFLEATALLKDIQKQIDIGLKNWS